MVVEQAGLRAAFKPWGSHDLGPWAAAHHGDAVGEIWFERNDPASPDPALLLKLLFTEQTLSIQVHPDDRFAQSLGQRNGKTEAWYVLSAEPDARVAVGLKRELTRSQLRHAILDGSIAALVEWRSVAAGEVIFIPAGTIHAIGAGLVIAEIQQRSDATFRLFDYGRDRKLHVDQAVDVADRRPANAQAAPVDLSQRRKLLISCPYFTLEQADLPALSRWELNAECETWALVIAGDATIGPTQAVIGEAFFIEDTRAPITVGSGGVRLLLAYASAEPSPRLLRDLEAHRVHPAAPIVDDAIPASSTTIGRLAGPVNGETP
jgi:mannose-6-phosphate isomerase